MKEYHIKNGTVLVDDEDYEKLVTFNQKWYKDKAGYAIHFVPGSRSIFLRMHRWILDCQNEIEVDHINRNKLDNRKENLRQVPHHINLHNQKLRTDNTNGYKGLFQNTAGNWGYQTWIKGIKSTKQGFVTAEDAYKAKVAFLKSQGITVV